MIRLRLIAAPLAAQHDHLDSCCWLPNMWCTSLARDNPMMDCWYRGVECSFTREAWTEPGNQAVASRLENMTGDACGPSYNTEAP